MRSSPAVQLHTTLLAILYQVPGTAIQLFQKVSSMSLAFVNTCYCTKCWSCKKTAILCLIRARTELHTSLYCLLLRTYSGTGIASCQILQSSIALSRSWSFSILQRNQFTSQNTTHHHAFESASLSMKHGISMHKAGNNQGGMLLSPLPSLASPTCLADAFASAWTSRNSTTYIVKISASSQLIPMEYPAV